MVILNITEALPVPLRDREKDNDILLITAEKHKALHPEAKHFFVLVIPFVSFLPALFFDKWKTYRLLQQKGRYNIRDYSISILSFPMRGYRIPFLRPLLNKIAYRINRKKMFRIIKEEQPDLIHAHNAYNTAYLARRLSKDTGIPYLISSRKINEFKDDTTTQKNVYEAKAVISINHIHKRIVDSLISSTRSYLLPHGLDERFLLPLGNPNKTPNNPVKLISICRIVPLKNIDQVLLALNRIALPFTYHVYGEGPDMQRLRTLATALKMQSKVKFMGHADHEKVPELLSEHDIFVMPSYPETFGRIYLEAMGRGLPVIAAKNTGMDGYIENNTSGFLIDHRDVDELSDLLFRLIQNKDLRLSIGKQAQDTAKKFSWEVIISKLHGIYTFVLGK